MQPLCIYLIKQFSLFENKRPLRYIKNIYYGIWLLICVCVCVCVHACVRVCVCVCVKFVYILNKCYINTF